MQSWIHVIEWRANTRPELTALVDDRGAAYTYAQLRAETERKAGGWARLGVGSGDVVAVVAKNSADFLVHAFALMRAGATPAFVNWRLSPRELAEVLALVEPKAIAADAEFAELVSAGRGGTDPEGPASVAPSVQPSGTDPPPMITRGSGPGHAAFTRPANSASAAIAFGSTSVSTSVSSRGDSRQLTKAGVAPARISANACTRKSALFLATTATTSPGPIPPLSSPAQPPALRSTSARSCA